MRDFWRILANLMMYHDAPDGPFVLHYTMFNVSNPGYVVYSIYVLNHVLYGVHSAFLSLHCPYNIVVV